MRRTALEDKYIPEPNSGCWIWIGARAKTGYGSMRDAARGHSVSAHRYLWEMENGPIPEGLEICHKCDMRPCVNPSHMFVGTRSDNMKDCVQKKRNFSPALRGADNPFSKLTDDVVREIRRLRTDGMLLRVIADRFGICQATASKIALRKGWSHVE